MIMENLFSYIDWFVIFLLIIWFLWFWIFDFCKKNKSIIFLDYIKWRYKGATDFKWKFVNELFKKWIWVFEETMKSVMRTSFTMWVFAICAAVFSFQVNFLEWQNIITEYKTSQVFDLKNNKVWDVITFTKGQLIFWLYFDDILQTNTNIKTYEDFEKLNWNDRKQIFTENKINIHSFTQEEIQKIEWKVQIDNSLYDMFSEIYQKDLAYLYYNYNPVKWNTIWAILSWIFNFWFIIIIWYFLYKTLKMMPWSMDKDQVKELNKDNIETVKYWGNSHLKSLFDEIIYLNKNGTSLKSLKWVLLYWPPWNWKTLFAQYLAKELDLPIFALAAGEFKNMYVWWTEWNIKSFFTLVRKKIAESWKTSALVFLDELDSIWWHRNMTHEATQWWLNILLKEMDWFMKDNIMVIWATNRMEYLDSALLSRFNQKVYVWNPTYEERKEILKNHLENLYEKRTEEWKIIINNDEWTWKPWTEIQYINKDITEINNVLNIKELLKKEFDFKEDNTWLYHFWTMFAYHIDYMFDKENKEITYNSVIDFISNKDNIAYLKEQILKYNYPLDKITFTWFEFSFINYINLLLEKYKDWKKKISDWKFYVKKLKKEIIVITEDQIKDEKMLEDMAFVMEWFSWRDIGKVVDWIYNKALVQWKKLDFDLFWEAVEEHIIWKEKKIEISDEELNRIAYHEVWHWFIWRKLWKSILKIAIWAKSMSLWQTFSIDTTQKLLKTETEMLEEVYQLVAWKLAEKVFLWNVSAWWTNDYQRVYKTLNNFFMSNLEYKLEKDWITELLKFWYIKEPTELTSREKEKLSLFVKETTLDIEQKVEKMLIENKDIIEHYAKKLYEKKIIDWKDFII